MNHALLGPALSWSCLVYTSSNNKKYLHSKCAKNNGAENRVLKDSVEDIPLSVDLACVYFIKKLHHDKSVENDGVVLRRRRVERGVAATVNVKDLLTWSNTITVSFMLSALNTYNAEKCCHTNKKESEDDDELVDTVTKDVFCHGA